jgi:ribosomal protein S18 acetylase RimI-like enzyme
MSIRPATLSDLEPLARIWYDGWKLAHTGLLPPGLAARRTPESFRERMRADLSRVRVAGPPDAPVGFCLVRGDELCQLYIDLGAQGRGVAAALVVDAERIMRAAGVETAWLACAVGNERAARFYEKQGWHRAGTVPHEPDDSGGFVFDVWRYEKRIA